MRKLWYVVGVGVLAATGLELYCGSPIGAHVAESVRTAFDGQLYWNFLGRIISDKGAAQVLECTVLAFDVYVLGTKLKDDLEHRDVQSRLPKEN